ncbi:MAG: DNA recombination protein RmuC [Fimbriimonadaceae bacterium]
MDIAFALGGLVVGLAVGLVFYFAARSRASQEQSKLQADKSRLEGELTQLVALRDQLMAKEAELTALRDKASAIETARAEAETRAAAAEESKDELLEAQRKNFEEQKKLLIDADRILGEKFGVVSTATLKNATDAFLKLANEKFEGTNKESKAGLEKHKVELEAMVKPLTDGLNKLEKHNKELEEKRVSAFDHLEKEMRRLSEGTGQLANALRKPATVGGWGEGMLIRILENAGFIENTHYEVQHTTDDGEDRLRADVVVHLPHGRDFVIDCKTPLDAFTEGMNAPDEESRRERFAHHAKLVRDHMKHLSSKAYWERYPSADCVLMFLPTDGSFLAAIEADPSLVGDAHKAKVYIVNPSTVLSMVHVTGYVLRQERLHETAQEVQAAATELYRRLSKFTKDMGDLGRHLNMAVGNFNTAVGALDSRVLPQARKMNELGGGGDAIAEVVPIDSTPRPLASPEASLPFDEPVVALPKRRNGKKS